MALEEKNIKLGTFRKDLGEHLVDKGVITAEVLAEAMKLVGLDENQKRRKLPEILSEDFRINRDKLYQEIVNFYAFRSLEIAPEEIEEAGVEFIKKELLALPDSVRDSALEFRVMPYMVDPNKAGRLLVITPDPTKPEVYRIARKFQYPKFEICYVKLSAWEELWQKVNIGRSEYAGFSADTGETRIESELDEAEIDEQALQDEIAKSGLVNLVEKVFIDAVRVGASDIHVLPKGEKRTEFHFRVDGKLTLWYTQTDTRAEAVSAVVKDRAKNLDRFERHSAQDGFAQFVIDGKTVRFRVSVIPVVGKELKSKFESIVIRVLQDPKFSVNVKDLGFDPYAEKYFVKAISKPHGIIIVTGPTGSGKSTTLFAALRTIMDPTKNVITVEDPVEYYIEGARQTKLNPKLDFEGALRAILRHDPDIVMVGEMRDKKTAEMGVKLANTGHLTFSTLHTNDAPSAIARLYKMGVEPFLIAYSVNLVLAQRLVRRLCEKCKAPVKELNREMYKKLGMQDEEFDTATLFEPVGCKQCMKGYKGRIAIHEALYFTKEIRRIILQAGELVDEESIRQAAARNGMRTLRDVGMDLVKRGVTSLDEIASVTVEDD
ncbi:MAG: GspE/PulE family protein [Ignavibacteriae bacterium]|nr:GspE/PulE family protein [Ignavibacteriota bacterium]